MQFFQEIHPVPGSSSVGMRIQTTSREVGVHMQHASTMDSQGGEAISLPNQLLQEVCTTFCIQKRKAEY